MGPVRSNKDLHRSLINHPGSRDQSKSKSNGTSSCDPPRSRSQWFSTTEVASCKVSFAVDGMSRLLIADCGRWLARADMDRLTSRESADYRTHCSSRTDGVACRSGRPSSICRFGGKLAFQSHSCATIPALSSCRASLEYLDVPYLSASDLTYHAELYSAL
jgi:hypothetical protein